MGKLRHSRQLLLRVITFFAFKDSPRLLFRLLAALGFLLLWGTAEGQSAGVITAINISARAAVGAEKNDVLVGGFFVESSSKYVLVRVLGPSLSADGLSGVLQDPILELYDSSGTLIASNDNWRETQEAQIAATGLQPVDNRESALLMTLQPGSYTAVAQGKAGGTGIAVVELYDLETASNGRVTNASARGNASLVESAIIDGFVIPEGSSPKVLARATGPELAAAGLTGVLQDTTLELRDRNGDLFAFNDDWETDQEAGILFRVTHHLTPVSQPLCAR